MPARPKQNLLGQCRSLLLRRLLLFPQQLLIRPARRQQQRVHFNRLRRAVPQAGLSPGAAAAAVRLPNRAGNLPPFLPTQQLSLTLAQAPSDRAIVRSIVIRGFSGRPSSSCTACPVGSFAAAASAFCRQCPLGMVPSAAGNACVDCSPGTFQPVRGATKCLPCGEGLWSAAGSSFCSSNANMFSWALDPSLPHSTSCRYNTPHGTYDTRPLAKVAAAQQRAGVVDNSTMQYYFSVCPETFNASQFRGSCVGKNGRHVDAPSCQVTTSHFSYAIGRYPSFSPLPPAMDAAGLGGFALTFWDGDASAACATRNMTIFFQCDPEADVGAPTAPNGLAEHKACMYSFEWRSAYVSRLFAARSRATC